MKMTRHANVFDALADDVGVAENLKIRAQLMNELSYYIERHNLTQARAGELFEVGQPRISDLVRGKIERFTIDMLVNMLARTGKQIDVKIKSEAA